LLRLVADFSCLDWLRFFLLIIHPHSFASFIIAIYPILGWLLLFVLFTCYWSIHPIPLIWDSTVPPPPVRIGCLLSVLSTVYSVIHTLLVVTAFHPFLRLYRAPSVLICPELLLVHTPGLFVGWLLTLVVLTGFLYIHPSRSLRISIQSHVSIGLLLFLSVVLTEYSSIHPSAYHPFPYLYRFAALYPFPHVRIGWLLSVVLTVYSGIHPLSFATAFLSLPPFIGTSIWLG
jgi:hypothetical protein